MKRFLLFLLLLGLVLESTAQNRRPNVVFVLADDLGWAELGCYGNGFNETPHLDRLAKEGVRFTHAYAAAPVCSPYRAALLTGQHPARVGITDYLRPNSSNGLPVSHVALPEILAKHEYTTGMVGKWHLTGYKHHEAEFELRPRDHGFGWNTGSEVKGVGNGANFFPYVFRTQPISWIDLPKNKLGKGEYLTDRLNHEAVEFIERNHQRPFFLYLSHYAPHTILNGKPDLVEKYLRKHPPGPSTRDRERCYLCKDSGMKGDACYHWASHHNPHLAAMLESIDDGIGMIDRKLRELGIDRDTIFIFSSDNGGETNVTSNAPLRGGKSQLYEGGIRVPLIVRWPNGKVPAGRVSKQPVVNHDFYPTFLEAADIDPDPAQLLDGVSMLPTLRNPDQAPKREALHWHYPLDKPHFLGGVSGGAIRVGDWKLIEFFDPAKKEKHALFNLAKDPSEKTDLAIEEPERVRALQSRYLDSARTLFNLLLTLLGINLLALQTRVDLPGAHATGQYYLSVGNARQQGHCRQRPYSLGAPCMRCHQIFHRCSSSSLLVAPCGHCKFSGPIISGTCTCSCGTSPRPAARFINWPRRRCIMSGDNIAWA